MDRRDFLKMAAMAGIAVASPIALQRNAKAADLNSFDGPYYVMVNAGGGWDTTYLCDPKGVNGINQAYRAGDILSPNGSPIRYAPVGVNQSFFEKYASELLVVNGIDMVTNGHAPGSRYAWSGSLNNDYYPSFAALVAATKAPDLPLAYLSHGGYDVTANLIPLSRITKPTLLNDLAYPNTFNNNTNTIHSETAYNHLQKALQGRRERTLKHAHLPDIRHAMSTLFTAQLGMVELKRITQHLPDPLPADGIKMQAAISLAAFKAGLSVSTNIGVGGFDTHDNHDAKHLPNIARLLEGIDFTMERAEQLGIREKIVIVASSDFGRTPGYNAGKGKDHLEISSAMFLGNSIKGNRVIGGTNDMQENYKINPDTLSLDENGIALKPEHFHHALRRHAGITDHELSKAFDLSEQDLNLFN